MVPLFSQKINYMKEDGLPWPIWSTYSATHNCEHTLQLYKRSENSTIDIVKLTIWFEFPKLVLLDRKCAVVDGWFGNDTSTCLYLHADFDGVSEC